MSDASAGAPGLPVAELAAKLGLHRVGARPNFFPYLKAAWLRRDFIWHMAKYRLMNQFATNKLGMIWLVIGPLFNALLYGIIFGVLQGDRRPPGFPARVVIGVFLFEYFRGCLNRGAKSITSNRSLVQSLAFPRVTLPLAVVAEELLSVLPAWGLLFIAMPVLGYYPTWSWLEIFPVFLLSILLNTGVALIAARLTVHLRDIRELVPLFTRILFFTSGILFDVSRIFEQWPSVVVLYDFHPVYQMVQLARHAFMGIAVDPMYWVYFSAFAVLVFGIGLRFFWSAEERYGR